MIGRLFLSVAILVSSVAAAVPVSAGSCSLTAGAVVQLNGTPHLFIVDRGGTLHWGGDTRALAGKSIDWNNWCTVGLDALKQMRRGDPWLSSGLPKIGDPIYLSKWEDTDTEPTLLHIQSISDVELFGINERNYGNFVLDRVSWERRYGFSVSALQMGPLASAHSFAWSSTDQSSYLQLLTNLRSVLSAALFRASQAGTDGVLMIPAIADCERSGLNEFDRSRNPSTAMSVTQDCLSRLSLGGGPGPNPGPGQSLPFPPGNVRVLALSPTVVRVLWSDVPNEFGFRIYGGDQTVPSTLFVTGAPANTTSQDIAGRSPGTTYCYAVSAFNPAGESPLSGPVCATTPAANGSGLSAPTNLVVSQIIVGTALSGLRIDWTDNSSNETSFQIVRGDQQIASVGPNVTSYADLTWTPSLPNCYRVVAVKELDQASSQSACASVANTQPTAPSSLALSPLVGRALRLDWGDMSANEDGFQILRNNLLIVTVPANTISYTDPNPDAGQNCYRVAAYNATGAAYSNQVCRTI